ncbi:hypothetical protein [Lentzea albidocapillata]|uniref:Uncharacterized protein n=1 Tax=Lentzea albidocapillata TaxID=40571 RepID=A0A1W2FQG6_9PSEU|nr:hypothetical protein [Lentzea albidocapillata]SMD24207.1 hypothetical protein SAMN05660733_07673 [Lentzea albidocapillata]
MTTQQAPQRDEAWAKAASPQEVARAHAAGELAELLGAHVPRSFSPDTQLSDNDLRGMTPGEIAKAVEAGAVDELLGRNNAVDGV